MRIALAAAAVSLLVPSAVAAPTGSVVHGSVRVGGLVRTYRMYVPSRLRKPSPVVLVFHGAGGNAESMARSAGFDVQAERAGFIVAYPNGIGRTWNAGSCCGPAERLGADDVGFVSKLLDKLALQYRVDSRRVYATGMSNGGLFSYALACRLSGRLAAAAPVAATLVSDCAPSSPVSIVHVHGLEDPRIPFGGGPGTGRATIDWPPVQAGIDAWRGLDGCPATGTTSERGRVTVSDWSPCRSGTAVRLITLAGVGHTWPHTPLDATAAVWRFFASHPKR